MTMRLALLKCQASAARLANQCKLVLGDRVCSSLILVIIFFNVSPSSVIFQTNKKVFSRGLNVFIIAMPLINVTKLSHFSGHKDAVYTLCNAPGKKQFYSGGGDGYVVGWEHEGSNDGKLAVRVNRPVYGLHISRDEELLYCGAASGNLHVVDLNSGEELRNIEAHANGVYELISLGEYLISGGGDGNIIVWLKKDMSVSFRIGASDKSARCMALNPSKSLLAVGFSDHKIRIYSTVDFKLLDTIDAHSNSVFSVVFINDTELMSGGRDALLKRWKLFESTPVVEIPAHTLHINHIALNPVKQLFATVSMDKTIKIWQTEDMKLIKVIDFARNEGHRSSVNKCLWLNDKTLVTGSDDRTVMMWNIEYDPEL